MLLSIESPAFLQLLVMLHQLNLLLLCRSLFPKSMLLAQLLLLLLMVVMVVVVVVRWRVGMVAWTVLELSLQVAGVDLIEHVAVLKHSNGRTEFKTFIDYRVRHWKGITLYNATEVSLQQKCIVQWTKMYF
jgi:hypothetical protein